MASLRDPRIHTLPSTGRPLMLKNLHLTPKYGGNILKKYTKPQYFAYTHYEIKMVAPGLIKNFLWKLSRNEGQLNAI